MTRAASARSPRVGLSRLAFLSAFLLALLVVAGGAAPCLAGQIGFVEDFALAKDRTVPLQQLIPGTEDYYYYHCLHFQNTAQFDKVPPLLATWIQRYNRTPRVLEIENRQALLTYDKNPQAALDLIRTRLNLPFNHQKDAPAGTVPNLPTRLDPALISRAVLTQQALVEHPGTVEGFEPSALEWLIATPLDGDRRRHLLTRLTRPDYENLPQIVLDDLRYKNSGGFGSLEIHKKLLLAQLDDLLKLEPKLLNEGAFVQVYLAKLQPGADVDWRRDPKAKQDYLDRLWAFASRLAPVHNSLKACILYHRLVLDRSLGVWDKDRFLTYLKLPRSAGYMRPEYLDNPENRNCRADLNANYESVTLLPPIGNDEPLVRSFFLELFVTENTYEPYVPFVHDAWLKDVFAETKIVNALGDMETWYSMLPPQRYQALKDRIDLDFAFTSKTQVGPAEPVVLDVLVKNVPTLIVKVYQVNTLNFYRSTQSELDASINLDGLVANLEKTYTYADPPLRRVKRRFEFPTIKDRGVYVIDFIGNGKASRAVIRKGRLGFLVRTSAAGQVFTILDESNKKVPDARVLLGGREFTPDKEGQIVVPFSNAPGRQAIVLAQGEFACLDTFTQEAEAYKLEAGIHVERESLLRRKTATVAVRPMLYVNGIPMSVSVLEQPSLTITSVDQEGVATTKEVGDFKLSDDQASTYEFLVPENLASISFALKARIQVLSQNKKQDLTAARAFQLNQIEKSDKVEDLHLSHIDGQYFLDVLGKSGEVKADRPVRLAIKHRDFRRLVQPVLKTDKQGRLALGSLDGIDWVQATGPEGTSHQWMMVRDLRSTLPAVNGKAGEAISIAYMGTAKEPQREAFSLLEVRGQTFVRDCFSAIKLGGGFITIQDLPAGDYDLLLKETGQTIHISLSDGVRQDDYVLGHDRFLQTADAAPLQIVSVQADKDTVRIQLKNATAQTRVHVAVTKYLSEYPIFPDLSVSLPSPGAFWPSRQDSIYMTGRDIGDEYRYIIDRKYAAKFPGNMLTRPGLLLNPWAVRKTETDLQKALEGTEMEGGGAGSGPKSTFYGMGGRAHGPGGQQYFANLDFLSQAAVVRWNLQPDANGVVTIARKDLGAHQQIHVLAADPQATVYRELSITETPMEFEDLRLLAGLDPARHFTEKKQVSIIPAKGELVLADIASAKFEAYDSLPKVFGLYATLSGNATLAEFNFVLAWPKLKAEEKREKYAKYACHELNFFLSRKDPEFFAQVVQPYLKNKKDKTFLDHYLIGDDLGGYLQPWAHAQLNVVERILLARRIQSQQAATRRHVKDLYDLIPPDIERFNLLFQTALRAGSLETGDRWGYMQAQDAQNKLQDAKGKKELLSLGGAVPAPAEAAPTNGPVVSARFKQAAQGGRNADKAVELRDQAKDLDEADDGTRQERAAAKKPADAAARSGEALRRRGVSDAKKRSEVRQFYRNVDKTEEYAENNYYHLAIEAQNADLVKVNGFWKDYADAAGDGAFYSTHLAEAASNFTEIMLALSVIDLPFDGGKHATKFQDATMTLSAGSPMVVFHREIKPAQDNPQNTPILVSQNFFRASDRYQQIDNERVEKYVTGEFLIDVVYGCQVVVTNPTSARQKIDILLQVPRGSIPVANTLYTRGLHVDLEPYTTQRLEYFFYFPAPGNYPHYPVQVAKNEMLVASCPPVTLKVVEKPTKVDTASWDYVSQYAADDEVLAYLKANNPYRVNLDRVAWRMRNAAFFKSLIALLQANYVYSSTLWSYGVMHNVPAAIREFLQHADGFVAQCGPALDSPLLVIDPVQRKAYQHLEYMPLINARAHKLGARRTILNDRFFEQYQHLMTILTCRASLDGDDLMAVTYYLLLQDRIEEAAAFFARVDPKLLATSLQYDYFAAYLDFYTDKPEQARPIALKYKAYPVDRWRNLFANVVAQLDEVAADKGAAVVDKEDRTQTQTKLAAGEGSLEFKVEARQVSLTYQNLAEVRVNYYLMDIELLFSRNPFVQQYSDQFSYIRPNLSQVVKLDAKKTALTFELPKEFGSSNVMVEMEAGGVRKSQAYFANSLAVQVIENYGQLKVTNDKTGKPIPKAYVKVYAQMKDGPVRFYKDGYTDLRGRFEYSSLSTSDLDGVQKFSILVLTEKDGAVVREASPPKQ